LNENDEGIWIGFDEANESECEIVCSNKSDAMKARTIE
jgi:hypothetical protein